MIFANYELCPADELGVDSECLDDLVGRVEHAVEKGPLPAIQIAMARHGRLVLLRTFGAADNATRFCIYSCTKPLVASAIWQLMGEGLIDIERPVCHYIGEFAGEGKDEVTVEQVLCHTAGFPQAPMGPPEWYTRRRRIERMRSWYLEWEPGSRMVYHPTSAHWVLAELIEQITGTDYRDYIRNRILLPLGINGLQLGVPEDDQGNIAILEHVGEPPTDDELQQVFGSAIDWPDTRDDANLLFNEPEVRALGVPGGGAFSTAADVALFYQALMRNPGELWRPDVLADAVGRARVDFPDPITRIPANRGLGVVIAGEGPHAPYRGMGRKVSSRAFGHQGLGGQIAWCDPATGLSFCLLTNGLDVNPIRSARFCASVNNRAGICVGEDHLPE